MSPLPSARRSLHDLMSTTDVLAQFAALHPELPLGTSDPLWVEDGSITIHLHGNHALEHLAQWARALGHCAPSSNIVPSAVPGGAFATETREGIFAKTKFKVIAYHSGSDAHDPYQMAGRRENKPTTRPAQPGPSRSMTHRSRLLLTAAFSATAATALAARRAFQRLAH
ncbi:hypothetical protein ACH4VR_29570 [Streptomyces sp. NPDC020883]|uniref:hypothetical protein n=1 Tax=Streptomyces sp. NPDC020883 TaxID=3365099 RepID=UPI0037B87841